MECKPHRLHLLLLSQNHKQQASRESTTLLADTLLSSLPLIHSQPKQCLLGLPRTSHAPALSSCSCNRRRKKSEELCMRPQHVVKSVGATHASRASELPTSQDMTELQPVERGKLPAEAPSPTNGFGVHMMTLRNFVSAGLDMKNKGDYESTVSLFARAVLLSRLGRDADACYLISGSSADGAVRRQH